MADILSTITSRLDDQAIGRIGSMLGADSKSTANAIESALPMLIAGLSRNAKSDSGASAIQNAIERDHDGSILDQLGSFLDRGPSDRDSRIVDHVFGGKRQNIQQKIGQSSGLSGDAVNQLLATLAPMVMGAIGKQRPSGSSGGLGSLLGAAEQMIGQQGASSLVSGLLDGDGDGDVDISDLTRLGGGLLSRFGRGN
jgi:hypothetical protein